MQAPGEDRALEDCRCIYCMGGVPTELHQVAGPDRFIEGPIEDPLRVVPYSGREG